VITALQEKLAALREGAGPDIEILVDLNFNFKTDGFIQIARAIEAFDLMWVELDSYTPEALAHIRSQTTTPVASGESLFGRHGYKPFFDA